MPEGDSHLTNTDRAPLGFGLLQTLRPVKAVNSLYANPGPGRTFLCLCINVKPVFGWSCVGSVFLASRVLIRVQRLALVAG
jgi:hypothetical protein